MLQETETQFVVKQTHNPPILSLARRLEALYQQAEQFDFSSWGAEISALEDEISANPATSLAEAAIQVMLASAYIERVREDLVDDTDVILQKMERLVRSALSAVVRETGVNLTEFAGERYAPSYTDPFRESPVCN
jgi:AICAR transformylase/IMP cyclohydrolase PurH